MNDYTSIINKCTRSITAAKDVLEGMPIWEDKQIVLNELNDLKNLRHRTRIKRTKARK